jgi:hypothetical protein
MKKCLLATKIFILATAWLCFASAGTAQEPEAAPQDRDKPKPAAKSYGPIGSGDQDQNPAPDALQPDQRPLTGIQQPTVGTPMERHSYWVPGLSYYNFIQSNDQSQGGGNSWTSSNYVAGNLSLLENWSRSQLAINYSGGGDFSTDSSVGNGWFQQFGATQTLTWERAQLTLLDQFAYLPQSQFGFAVGTGLVEPGIGGSLGVGSTGVGVGLDPSQSIFTAIGPRYSNTFGAQVNYQLSARSSVTVGGVYSLLRFSQAGNIESDNYIGNAGYNYQVTRNDTLGLIYRYGSFHYIGFDQAIGDQIIQAAYGRKITGRLALRLTGGPDITHFRMVQGTNGKTRSVSGSGSASITYSVPKGSFSANYLHGLTSGSGVFLGATSDQITGSTSRKLTRVWSGDAHVGYARNRNAQTTQGTANLNFDTVFAGASVARALGRDASFSLGYTAYIEKANGTVCAGPNCGSDFATHQISVGLSWHTRPFVLR